jgi:hypothetical protein
MGRGAKQGFFRPKFPDKYKGNADNIIYRSGWEKAFMQWCDDTPSVELWASEEFHIPYMHPEDNRWHRYFPDFWLRVRNRDGRLETWVVEIKPKAQTVLVEAKRKTRRYYNNLKKISINKAKWHAAVQYCAKKGWAFKVLTEEHLFPKKGRAKKTP